MYFTDNVNMDSTIYNMHIEQNIILWSCREAGIDHIPEFIGRSRLAYKRPPTPDFELELQQEEVKHGEYAAHILIQKQAREYACAVEDSICLLKRGTEEILHSLTSWKDSSQESLRECSYKKKSFDELTHIGKQVLFISEAVKKLHDENAAVFWTSGHRERILKSLVSFSKDAVKLRRKLERIKSSLETRVRRIRKVVITFGSETGITENLVPPDIYREWDSFQFLVREDKDLLANTAESQKQEQEIQNCKSKLGPVRKVMHNIITNYCGTPDGSVAANAGDNDSNSATKNEASKFLKYQMRKDIEILHKEESGKVTESSFEGVLGHLKIPPSSSNPIAVVSIKESQRLQVKAWGGTLSPSNIVLKKIASNIITPLGGSKNKSNKMEAVIGNEEYELKNTAIWQQLVSVENDNNTKPALESREDHEEQVSPFGREQEHASFVHVSPTQNHNVPALDSNEQKTVDIPLEDNENNMTTPVFVENNPPIGVECLVAPEAKETKVIYAADFTSKGYEHLAENEENSTSATSLLAPANRVGATEDVILLSGITSEMPLTDNYSAAAAAPQSFHLEPDFTVVSWSGTSSVKNTLSRSMTKQILDINATIQDVQAVVQQTMYTIREVERSWLNPSQYINSKSRRLKELFQLLDFVADTVKLVSKPSFASRLYKEDLQEIVAVLDPVFREVTNCYVTLCELHDRVMVDTRYLKELVSGFPKNSLVIHDWVSDPFLDETLNKMEQHQYMTELDVDVEELFS